MIIDKVLVHDLLTRQFPKWKDLPIQEIANQGWDNRTFRLGNELLARLPSRQEYTFQVKKEQIWLPKLAPHLPYAIPVPIALGHSDSNYPWEWSIYKWLKGAPASYGRIDSLENFAYDLAGFINAFQKIDTTDGPLPSAQNFHRGGSLLNYNNETRKAISLLNEKLDQNVATELWEKAIDTKYTSSPVWVHGDISPGNLLVANGTLTAVIEFGQLAIGDPACDLMIAYTMFKGKSREVFVKALNLDQEIWIRARAWTLWKSLIIASGLSKTNSITTKIAFETIKEVLISD